MAATINYTSRDFQTILTDMRTNLTNAVPGVNDFLESSEGRFLLDQWAAVAEMCMFALDRQAAESYIDTAETRDGLVSLLKLIGYHPANPTPEEVSVEIKRSSAETSSDLVIPRKTKIFATSPSGTIPFYLNHQVTVVAGSTSATVLCTQGEWVTHKTTSNGGQFQAVILPSKSIASKRVEVSVDGSSWVQATDNTFVGHSASDRVFRLVPTADKRLVVEFGNGSEGAIPEKGKEIQFDFLVTRHTNGHINTGELIDIDFPGVTSYNAQPSSGGIDFENLETARRKYPSAFKAMRRAVTLGDWEALASNVSGVLQAKATDINLDPSLPHFAINVYVVGEGGFVSEALNDTVTEELRNRRVNATIFEVISPSEISVDVVGQVFIYRVYDQNSVMADVVEAVRNFFTMSSEDSEIQIGVDIPQSRLLSVMQAVDGVSHINLSSPDQNITVGVGEYATLNTVNLTIGGIV